MVKKKTGIDAILDVGILVIGLTKNPANKYCLKIIDDAVHGTIKVVIPYTVVLGAHLIMKRIYGIDSKKASDLLLNLMDSKRIIWWDKISKNIVETGLNYASEYNIDSWDGYLLAIMKQNGIDTVYTIDKDFENIRSITMINPIPKDVMGELSKFLEKS